MTTASRIVAARKARGLTQSELADMAQVNLRTIQRIEKGQTEPRGFTLKAIAGALDFTVAELVQPEPEPEPEDMAGLQWLNLSALAMLVLPYGNLLVPLLVWRKKKAALEKVRPVARRIINFQVLWSIALALGLILCVVLQILFYRYFSIRLEFALWTVFILLYLLNIAAILFYGSRIKKGDYNIYPVGIQLF